MPAHIRTCVQFLAAALILPLLFLSPSHPQSNQSASLFHEDVLAELTPGAEAKQILVADHHLAWVEKLGDKRSVHLDGKQLGGSFDDIKYLQFSRDESRLVFFGKHSRAWYFVDDGKEDSKAISSPTGVAFQPDGPSLAYGECSDHTCRLVIDGKESGAEYDNISYPRYSPDGKHLAFLAKRSKKWVGVVDGKELPGEVDEPAFGNWGFSRGSGCFFMSGRVKFIFIHVIDGSPTPGFNVTSRIAFTRDGSHYAYSGAEAKGGFKKQKIFGRVVKDGQPVATYEGKGMMGSWSAVGGSRKRWLAEFTT